MRERRGLRPMLNKVENGETALIWNPQYGFRLCSPERGALGSLTLPETFLTILAMQISDEMMARMTGEYLSHFRKH